MLLTAYIREINNNNHGLPYGGGRHHVLLGLTDGLQFCNTLFESVLRIRIRMDSNKETPPGSGSAWTDAVTDPGGKKA